MGRKVPKERRNRENILETRQKKSWGCASPARRAPSVWPTRIIVLLQKRSRGFGEDGGGIGYAKRGVAERRGRGAKT